MMGKESNYDISVIRLGMRNEDVRAREERAGAARLKKIKEGLRTLHTLELMASNIYKFQITKEATKLKRQLTAAMCNEMTHYQDFQVKLYEYGFKPSKNQGAILDCRVLAWFYIPIDGDVGDSQDRYMDGK